MDGGAAASDLLMQMQADLSGVRVARPENLETTALGAAFMAGLAVGVWPDRRPLAKTRRVEKTFTSRMPRTAASAATHSLAPRSRTGPGLGGVR